MPRRKLVSLGFTILMLPQSLWAWGAREVGFDDGSYVANNSSSSRGEYPLAGDEAGLCNSIRHQCAGGAQNCMRAIQQVSNKKAIRYAIAYMRDNTGSLADGSCRAPGSPRGIKNTRSFLLNDFESTQGQQKAMGYFVDFCNSSQPVKKFPVNKGTGRGFTDQDGAHTSVMGAFLTASSVQAFTPYSDRKGSYAAYRARYGQPLKLNLYGVNTSNNSTSGSKPLHESPYNSSWGCPSFGPGNRDVLQSLASNGPSLVVNYGPSSLHQSTTECSNESSGPRQRFRNGSGSGSGRGGQQ